MPYKIIGVNKSKYNGKYNNDSIQSKKPWYLSYGQRPTNFTHNLSDIELNQY